MPFLPAQTLSLSSFLSLRIHSFLPLTDQLALSARRYPLPLALLLSVSVCCPSNPMQLTPPVHLARPSLSRSCARLPPFFRYLSHSFFSHYCPVLPPCCLPPSLTVFLPSTKMIYSTEYYNPTLQNYPSRIVSPSARRYQLGLRLSAPLPSPRSLPAVPPLFTRSIDSCGPLPILPSLFPTPPFRQESGVAGNSPWLPLSF